MYTSHSGQADWRVSEGGCKIIGTRTWSCLCRHAKRPSDLGFADELPGRFGGLSFDGSILFPESVTPAVRPPTPPARPPTPPPCEPGSFLTAGGLRALWQRSRRRLVDAGVTEAPRPEGVEMGSMRACLTET